jgi:hypothetical protein
VNPSLKTEEQTVPAGELKKLPRIQVNPCLQAEETNVLYLLELKQLPSIQVNPSLQTEETNVLYLLGLKQLLSIQVNPSVQAEETNSTAPAGTKSVPQVNHYQKTEEQDVPSRDYIISPGSREIYYWKQKRQSVPDGD